MAVTNQRRIGKAGGGNPKQAARREELLAEYRDPVAKEARLARLEMLEDQILQNAAGIVQAALAFSEVAPDQAVPPAQWVEEYGIEGANQRLAVAKTGWMPGSQAPSGVQLASRIVTGIARARGGVKKMTQNNLNVTIALPAPASASVPGSGSEFPEKELE